MFSGVTLLITISSTLGNIPYIDFTTENGKANFIITAVSSLCLLTAYLLGRKNRVKTAAVFCMLIFTIALFSLILFTKYGGETILVYMVFNILYAILFLEFRESLLVSLLVIVLTGVFPIFYPKFNLILTLGGPVIFLSIFTVTLFYIIWFKFREEQIQHAKILELEKFANNIERENLLGLIARGISHDLNNQLTIVQSNLELLEMDLNLDSATDILEAIKISLNNTSSLAASLGNLEIYSTPKIEEISLQNTLKELELLTGRIMKDIQFEWEYKSNPKIRWMKSEISNALLNLIINAKDAIEQSGTIRICLDEVSITGNEIAESYLINPTIGNHALITVKDTGKGIRKEDIAGVILPFYSTKREKGSAGLGLSNVARVMKSVGGGLAITSELNKGTKVSLFFPSMA